MALSQRLPVRVEQSRCLYGCRLMVCMYVCMHVCMYVCVYVCMHACFFFLFLFFFNLTYSRWTSSLPSCLWSLRIFPSLPGSRLTIFYRDASSALLQLVNQWLNFTYSRSHAFRYEGKNTNPTLVRIELTTSALAGVQVTYLTTRATRAAMYTVFIKLNITAQSGPVILVILCHSHCSSQGGINYTCYENL